ncbi:MAG: YggS family pyridoxal phosphate-dependent enzyme [Candidatus Omnitrophota bacterium]
MIAENVGRLLQELPDGVQLEAAAKGRTSEEILQAIAAGVRIIGENYLQEAEKIFRVVGRKARWHFIGHLQQNKVKKAVRIFDLIETVDSRELAEEIDTICARQGKIMPVLIEVNSSAEKQKFGLFPQNVKEFIKEISLLKNIRVMGLMTMGPQTENPEITRPCFRRTKKLFDEIANDYINSVQMRYLSMGMSDSYRMAIEEGANIIRVGSKIFGPRAARQEKQ